jgi:hypothetical protein
VFAVAELQVAQVVGLVALAWHHFVVAIKPPE